ncbi:MAG: T9SS type A sorting domain-containing protein [Bacteroidota bacterium]|nr:T9SS type A sorting domain-containing protein [Bacteroidota bacterium]
MFRFTVIAIISIFCAIQQSTGQTHVQTGTLFQTTTANTIAVTFGAASTTGNLIVVHLDWDGQSRTISSVKDNKGNTYKKINGTTFWNGTHYAAELWYAYNITGAAAITVTAKLSGAPTSFSQMYISEYSGIVTSDPLDQNAVATGSSVAVSSGNKTITYNHELIYGASIGASGALTSGAGFTNRSVANNNIIEDKKAATVGSYNTSFTSAGGLWVAQMASFITTSSLIILPIDLLSFTGQCNNGHIVLAWTTASESNNDYFTVERSADGANWETIGTTQSAGNSPVSQNYSFTADQTNDQISYFRLKQTDLDGQFKYFRTIQVNNCFKNDAGLNIYPNPSNGRSLFGKLNLKASEAYTIEIFDNLGRPISRLVSTQPEFAVNFQQTLPSGVYFVKISSADFSAVKCFLVSH